MASDPALAEYQRACGREYLSQGRYGSAMAALREAVALRPDFADAWLDMVVVATA